MNESKLLSPNGVYFQKSFDFALDFVPLHRGSLPGQPVMAARGKVIQ